METILKRDGKNILENENFEVEVIVNKPHEKLHLT
jgi:hypothetical protein